MVRMSDQSVSALHASYQLAWYNSGNALWMGSFSIQQLLVIWILVGVLHETPERVGFAQMLISIPGLIFMLWGGVIGDRRDGRQLRPWGRRQPGQATDQAGPQQPAASGLASTRDRHVELLSAYV